MADGEKRADVPETISDEQMADIQRRALRAAAGQHPFAPEVVRRNLSSRDQYKNRHLN